MRPQFAVRLGYTTFDLQDMRDVMNNALSDYVSAGVPVREQSDFPGNISIGLDVVQPFQKGRVSLGATYSNTMGSFDYEDDAGRFQVKSHVYSALLQLMAAFDLKYDTGIDMYLGIRSGVFISWWKLEEKIVFYQLTAGNRSGVLEASTYGFVIEPVLGVWHRLSSDIVLGAEASYRLTPESLLERPAGELGVGIDLSGVYFGALIGLEF